jgi:hypothetical protein
VVTRTCVKKKGEGLSSVLRVVALRPLSWCPSAFSLSSSFFFLSVCLSVRLSPCLSVCRRRQDLSRPVRFPDDAPLSQVVSLQESWPRVQAWLDGPLRQAVGGALAAYCILQTHPTRFTAQPHTSCCLELSGGWRPRTGTSPVERHTRLETLDAGMCRGA